ncbi:unnamed protein product [Effrenium voratum]|nr:unnamed protein product [Effrenium voratum]CAJ1456173.1 unnamed protein product [Effrenium voratum]
MDREVFSTLLDNALHSMRDHLLEIYDIGQGSRYSSMENSLDQITLPQQGGNAFDDLPAGLESPEGRMPREVSSGSAMDHRRTTGSLRSYEAKQNPFGVSVHESSTGTPEGTAALHR